MSFREILTKLRNLPDNKKKVVLWTIVVGLAVIMGFFWIMSSIDRLSKLGQATQEIRFPTIDTSKIPSLDILQTVSPSNK